MAQEAKDQQAADMAQHAKELASLKANASAATVNKLSAEEEALRAETARLAQEAKDQQAADMAQHAKELANLKANASAATVAKLTAEEELLRAEAAEKSAARKAADQAEINRQNNEMKSKVGPPLVPSALRLAPVLSLETDGALGCRLPVHCPLDCLPQLPRSQLARSTAPQIESAGPAIDDKLT